MTPEQMLDAIGCQWRRETVRRRKWAGRTTLAEGDYYVVSLPGCRQYLRPEEVAEFHRNEMALRAA